MVLALQGCDAPTITQLVDRYPDLTNGREANMNIISPFQRLVEKSGLYDNYDLNNIPVDVVNASNKLGKM